MSDKLLHGWIIAYITEEEELKNLGIKVGEYNHEGGCFEDCEVSTEAMNKLDSLWGKFYWGLHTDDDERIGYIV